MLTEKPDSPSIHAAPGPAGFPLLGVLPKMIGNPLKFFLDAAIEWGDVVRLDMGGRQMVLVTRPESVQWVLQENNRNYRKGYGQAKPLLGEGLVTSEVPFWLRQRRLIQPLFHHQQIESYAAIMLEETEGMVARWQEKSRNDLPVEVANEMMRLTQKIILRSMFSTDIGEEGEALGRAIDQTLEALNRQLFTPSEALTRLPTPANLRNARALRFLDNYIYRLIGERRTSGEIREDLLSRLIQARDPETGEEMNERQIRDEAMTIFLAGHETTANALAWTFYLLSQHPGVDEQVAEEIGRVLGNRSPAVDDLPELGLVDRIFQESLRLYPPAWIFARTAVGDDEIGGFRVPAGQMLMISPYVTHRLPGVWEHPDRFDPDRFLPERSQDRPKFAYFPFGGGPRVCIGNHFATVEAELIMARVLQSFRLRLAPGYKVEPKPVATLQPRPGVLMYLSRRG